MQLQLTNNNNVNVLEQCNSEYQELYQLASKMYKEVEGVMDVLTPEQKALISSNPLLLPQNTKTFEGKSIEMDLDFKKTNLEKSTFWSWFTKEINKNDGVTITMPGNNDLKLYDPYHNN